ncbi:DUF4396 domain-containing protein [Streptomyces sp. NPDC001812]|uniref:DUF4396 domain-containing protein n=1 Tax=Streptomyces TaxID=1883 RepID=UPI003659CB0E
MSKAVSHRGAGCTLGDVSAEWLLRAARPTLAGRALHADFVLEFAFARILGVVFRYFMSAPMRDVSRAEGIRAAIKADTLSVLAFQVVPSWAGGSVRRSSSPRGCRRHRPHTGC